MKRILKERDRLLRRLARVTGMTGALGALLCLMVPTGSTPGSLAWGMLGCLAVAAAVGLATGRDAVGSSVAVVASAGAAVVAIALVSGRLHPSTATAIVLLSGVSAASVSFIMVVRPRLRIPLGLLAAVSISLGTAASFRPGGMPGLAMLTMSLTWLGTIAIALWIERAVAVAVSRIDEVGGAHRAERLASELEARQRQDARLLHDTVLATLSLLAHAGVGVAPDTLRGQARRMPGCCASCGSTPPRPARRRARSSPPSRPTTTRRSARRSSRSSSGSGAWGSTCTGTAPGRCCCRARRSTRCSAPWPSASRTCAGTRASSRPT
ncbi:hypothetical protein [Agromyces mangrovi Wang et al. 2018]|uniref:hypothetical protein n=1 Tax=Agromyces mangrovi TaxID=1858653 RepID=UPI00257312BC|nr:hypothetical protein [Agromyces mangrovi]BDZ65854.1 hypothetical protein GCM10025877_27920 [Agromyces mangrovi]